MRETEIRKLIQRIKVIQKRNRVMTTHNGCVGA